MILYEVLLYVESGKGHDALKHLEEFKTYISDSLSYAETKGIYGVFCGCGHCGCLGDILLADNKLGEAELLYRELLQRNPENSIYYQKLEQCLDLSKSHDCHMTFTICFYSNY